MVMTLAVATASAMAYERVDGGIQLGTHTYPVVISDELLAQIDAKFPYLIDWLLSSEAINEQEKQFLLEKLPVMTSSQRQRLNHILLQERVNLEQLNQEYKRRIAEINKKFQEKAKDLSPQELEKIKQRMIEKMKANIDAAITRTAADNDKATSRSPQQ